MNIARLTWLEGIQLRTDFEDSGMVKVDGKHNDLISRHIHRRGRRGTSPFDFGILGGSSTLPPLAGRQRFQVRKLASKRLRCFLGRQVEVR